MYEQTHRLAYFLTIAYKKTDVKCDCLGWINVRVGRSASDEHKLMFTAAVCYILCVIHCAIFYFMKWVQQFEFYGKTLSQNDCKVYVHSTAPLFLLYCILFMCKNAVLCFFYRAIRSENARKLFFLLHQHWTLTMMITIIKWFCYRKTF